ncbi:hypothetical protein ES703_87173 [subsurface metagenome]
MTEDKRYTSYCGLYCLDCIPSNKKLFSTIKELENLLADLQVGKYVEIKSKKNEIYKEYPKFIEVLQEIGKLESFAPCREGCKPNCKIRECVLNRNYEGCWECNNHRNCELLQPLKEIHPSLEYHLELIQKDGLENWSIKRRKHYLWE